MFESTSLSYPLIFVAIVGVLIYYALRKDKNGKDILTGKKIGKNSATPFLDLYTNDFTAMASQKNIDPVVGRDDEIKKLSQTLSRRGKNNAILIGAPGVGKTAIVEGLASRIIKKEVPEQLQDKRLLALDVATLMSGTKYRGEFEERAKKIVKEIAGSNRSIILFIDEVHSVVQSQGTEGAINFSDILKPALARGDLQMIGATTTAEYEKYIKTDSSLERRFQTIEVDEPNEAETEIILKGIKNLYREYHKVEFTDAALKIAVTLTNKKIKTRRLPDKAIDAIDEAGAMIKVGHINSNVPGLLYEVAIKKHPETGGIWKEIQKIDKELIKKNSLELRKKREELETKLEKIGMVTVDSNDIEEVVNGWTK